MSRNLLSIEAVSFVLLMGCTEPPIPAVQGPDPSIRTEQVLPESKLAKVTFIDPGIVSWWPADGNADDLISDNHGILHDGTTFVPGKVGQAFSFDGVNDYVEIPISSSLETPTWTIDFWFFVHSNVVSQAFVSNHDGTGSRYVIEFNADPRFGLRIGHFVLHPDLNTGLSPSVSTWHHLAAVQSTDAGIGQKLYLDGTLIGVAGPHAQATSVHLNFGQRGNDSFFLGGMLDEIEFYDRELAVTEIQAIIDAGNKGEKPFKMVAICHASGTGVESTLQVPYRAVSGHKRHGDTVGACD